MNVAYAVWLGIGTVLVAVIGLRFFQGSVTVTKMAALGLIVAGVVMLHFTSESY